MIGGNEFDSLEEMKKKKNIQCRKHIWEKTWDPSWQFMDNKCKKCGFIKEVKKKGDEKKMANKDKKKKEVKKKKKVK